MNPVDAIVDHLRQGLAPYPADEVARVSGQMGDAVLWSGPGRLQSSIDADLVSAAHGYLFMVAGILGLAAVFYSLYRRIRREGADKVMPFGTQFLYGIALSVAVFACVVGAIAGATMTGTAEAKGRMAVIVTANRIVQLEGEDRYDIPASAVTRVSQRGSVIHLNMADRNSLFIETAKSDTARLGQALEKVVDSAGAGSRILKDRLG